MYTAKAFFTIKNLEPTNFKGPGIFILAWFTIFKGLFEMKMGLRERQVDP